MLVMLKGVERKPMELGMGIHSYTVQFLSADIHCPYFLDIQILQKNHFRTTRRQGEKSSSHKKTTRK